MFERMFVDAYSFFKSRFADIWPWGNLSPLTVWENLDSPLSNARK